MWPNMPERKKHSIYERFFGGAGFVYEVRNGEPDYGSVKLGSNVYPIVAVNIRERKGMLIESVELDNGIILLGRTLYLRNFK